MVDVRPLRREKLAQPEPKVHKGQLGSECKASKVQRDLLESAYLGHKGHRASKAQRVNRGRLEKPEIKDLQDLLDKMDRQVLQVSPDKTVQLVLLGTKVQRGLLESVYPGHKGHKAQLDLLAKLEKLGIKDLLAMLGQQVSPDKTGRLAVKDQLGQPALRAKMACKVLLGLLELVFPVCKGHKAQPVTLGRLDRTAIKVLLDLLERLERRVLVCKVQLARPDRTDKLEIKVLLDPLVLAYLARRDHKAPQVRIQRWLDRKGQLGRLRPGSSPLPVQTKSRALSLRKQRVLEVSVPRVRNGRQSTFWVVRFISVVVDSRLRVERISSGMAS
jgi:hypothetical protein